MLESNETDKINSLILISERKKYMFYRRINEFFKLLSNISLQARLN